MTEPATPSSTAPQPPKTRIPGWAKVAGAVLAGLCVIGAIASAFDDDEPQAPSQPAAAVSASDLPVAQESPQPPPAPAEPITVQGRGKQVVPLPVTLNGRYLLEYTVDDNAFILKGLDASGQESGWFSWLNELDLDASTLTGSTVVNAENVVMVQSDNVDGSWTLTFTKLG